MIKYNDGNGNQYIITRESIEYNPVKPKFSSSGIYDGGENVIKQITLHLYNELKSLVKNAIMNKSGHVERRIKMSGAIIFKEGNDEKTCILSPHSEELNEIEIFLKNIIDI